MASLRSARFARQAARRSGCPTTRSYEIDFRLARKEDQFQQAIVLAYGMRFEALADDGVVMRGQPVKLSFAVANHGPADVTIAGVDHRRTDRQRRRRCRRRDQEGLRLHLHGDRYDSCRQPKITGPYWTPRSRRGTLRLRAGRAVRPAVPAVAVPGDVPRCRSAAQRFSIPRVLQYRYDNVVAGEKRMELSVVPAFSVRLTPDIVVFPASRGARRVAIGQRTRAGRRDQPAQGRRRRAASRSRCRRAGRSARAARP